MWISLGSVDFSPWLEMEGVVVLIPQSFNSYCVGEWQAVKDKPLRGGNDELSSDFLSLCGSLDGRVYALKHFAGYIIAALNLANICLANT